MKKIGVVGAGTMGQGIAASFASNGYQVTMCDIKIEWAQSGIDKIAANYDKLAAKGKITAEAVAEIKGNLKTGVYKDLADSDYDITKRNKRDVWTIPTHPYKGAHFAAFPLKLVIPCVLAGSREGDTILDPFFGSGTVGEAAALLNRNWFGIELNPAYQNLYKERLALFA